MKSSIKIKFPCLSLPRRVSVCAYTHTMCVRACVRARVCVCLSISRCLSVCVPHRVGAVQRLLLAVVGGDAVPAGGPAPQRGGGAAAGDGLQAGRPQHGLRGRVRTRGARLHREPGQRHSSSLLWHRSGGTSSLPVSPTCNANANDAYHSNTNDTNNANNDTICIIIFSLRG